MTRSEILAKTAETVEKTFGYACNLVSESTVAEDVPGWDSLSNTIFFMNVEDAFAVQLPVEDVFAFRNIGEVVDAVDRLLTGRSPH